MKAGKLSILELDKNVVYIREGLSMIKTWTICLLQNKHIPKKNSEKDYKRKAMKKVWLQFAIRGEMHPNSEEKKSALRRKRCRLL